MGEARPRLRVDAAGQAGATDNICARRALRPTVKKKPRSDSKRSPATAVATLFGDALAHHQAGRLAEARALYERVLAGQPKHFDSRHLLGVVLHQQGDHAAAVEQIDAALVVNPDNAFAYNNRAVALQAAMRFEAALESCDRAIALSPGYAEAFYNRGNALRLLRRFDDAATSYGRAVALKPNYPEAHYNRGIVLKELHRFPEARTSYAQAVALKPDFAEAQFGRCMTELPILYESEAEIAVRRAAYEQRLRALCDTADRGVDLLKGVGASQPFYLAYQGQNDRDLQARYGTLACRIMAKRYPALAPAPPPGDAEAVRVGIVSGFFHQHTVWKLMIKGWLSQLDRTRFRLFGYYTREVFDTETRTAAGLCERFVQGPLSLDEWRAQIAADAPHVLIYPEIGMDAAAGALAAQRLAAVQCNSWGHPDTSGFPTIDYFLSSDLMEPDDGREHYTERLVQLPNLSIHYEPIAAGPASVTRESLGFRAGATVFWCAQSLYKYLPQFDEVFPRIARSAGNCQFAFIHYQGGSALTDAFRLRLEQAFAAFGLKAEDYCIFLPRLTQDEFIAASGLSDVFLDSIGWSGGNTTLESLVHDLPIVTLPGPLMRGRHSAAILRMMDVTETIATTIEDYVSIAARLSVDVPWRDAVRARMSAGKHRVYGDRAAIEGLERFLDGAVRAPPDGYPPDSPSNRR
jgi:protein O-GlcNAc transferase